MGEPVLITTLFVIVIGGIGSVGGAFYSALIVGTVDTLGRAFLPSVLRLVTERSFADAAGPALASMLIYVLMRSEEHTSELPSLMRPSYAVFCLNQTNTLPKPTVSHIAAPPAALYNLTLTRLR